MRTPALAFAAAALLAASGCARTAEERQLDAMRAEIDTLQVERDQADQASGRTMPASDPSSARARAAAAPSPSGLPPGDGVVTAPESADEAPSDDYADPEDSTPRPRIRVFGSPRVTGREVQQIDDGTGTVSDETGRSTPLDPAAKRAYDAAMALVTAKRFDAALDALAAFLVKWPDHPYADHAMYWRGECYFARGDYARAADQFEGVLARFPAGAKAPDALLKLGMTEQRLGNAAKAKECLDRLTHDFPQSEAAARAPAAGGAP